MRGNRQLVLLLSALLLGCGGQATKADEPRAADETRALNPTPGATGAPGPAPLQRPGDHAGGLGDTKPGVPAGPIAPIAQDKPDGKTPDGKTPAKGPQKDERIYVATVKDRFGTPAFAIVDASLWVPEVSILGGEGGEEKKLVSVKHGAAEIEVPFAEIASIAVKEAAEDRLPVTITFKSADRPALEGTIKANLQLRGRYEKTDLRARLKLRELTELKLEESKEK